MATVNFRPGPLNFVNIVAGTDVRFSLDVTALGEDISGDTYQAIATMADDTEVIGTGTVSGNLIQVAWTDEQTLAMGPGEHIWRLWRIRSTFKNVPYGGVLGVIE